MVKCTNCGLLCVTGERKISYPAMGLVVKTPVEFPAPAPPSYVEFPRKNRKSGGGPQMGTPWDVICFAEEPQWAAEVEATGGEKRTVMERDRECDSFIEYVLGHGPKEHVMLKLQRRLEEREDARDKAQKDWQLEVDARAQGRHQDQMNLAKQTAKWEIIVLGIVAMIVLSAVTLLGSIIEANWWTPPWR